MVRPTVPIWVWEITPAVASGALMSLCYWPVNAHWLAWVALVPWIAVLPGLSPDRAGLFGVVLGLVFYRMGLAWLFQIHGSLAGISIFVLSVWMGLAFRAARMLMGRRPMALLWAVPFAFAGQEVLRCEGLPRLRFAFTALGYSQSHNLWVAQIASLGGVYLLSFLIVLVNAAVAYALIHRRVRSCVPAICAVAMVVLLAVISQPADDAARPGIAAACVQAESSRMVEYHELTRQAVEHPSRPKLIVLPEHTIADYADHKHPLVRRLGVLAREHGATICVGAHTEAPRDAECDYHNVAMLIGPQGTILHEQPKWVPLPFFSDGVPGRTRAVTRTAHGIIGTYVCYDGLFTDIPRRSVALGAEILLVPNMDAERWPAQERWQHADMAPFRSIELRRCAVRANSAGVSQIIDSAGRVVARRTKEEGPGVIVGAVYPITGRTVFARGGYLLPQIAGIGYLVMLIGLTAAPVVGRVRSTIKRSPRRHGAHGENRGNEPQRHRDTEVQEG